MYPSLLQGSNNRRRLRDLRIWDTDVPQRQQENTNLHYVTCQEREGLRYKAAATGDHVHVFIVHIITTGKYEYDVRSGRRPYGSLF
jgi:hypothetical protein